MLKTIFLSTRLYSHHCYLAQNDNYKLPDKIVSDEYITIEGEKLSKGKVIILL